MAEKRVNLKQSKKEIALWILLATVTCLAFVLGQSLIFNLFGYVSWTGVSAATVSSILNMILTGSSIWAAVAAIIGAAAAGPIVAVIQQIGITALKQWVKELGFKAVVGL